MAKRIKKIADRENKYQSVGDYDYNGLCHWWSSNFGRKETAYGRMSCSENTIYSYNSAIGHMYETPKWESFYRPLVLIRDYDGATKTTKNQTMSLLDATSHMIQIIVPYVIPDGPYKHIKNLEFFLKKAFNSIEKYNKARSFNSKERYKQEFCEAKKSSEIYAKYFKQRNELAYKEIMKLKEPQEEDSYDTLSFVENEFKKKTILAAQRKKNAEEKEKKLKKEKAHKDLEAWLKGEDVTPNSMYLDDTYLRIKGAVIETTRGAQISLKSCISAFKKYKAGTLEIGDEISGFTFNGVSNGVAKIGCHNVSMESINRLLGGVQNVD